MKYDKMAVVLIRCCLIIALILVTAKSNRAQTSEPVPIPAVSAVQLITMDFNNVDLPIFVKFISEITGRNFVIDERVRGKVTVFSPRKSQPIKRIRFCFRFWSSRA